MAYFLTRPTAKYFENEQNRPRGAGAKEVTTLCVKAIAIKDADDLTYRILSEIIGDADEPQPRWIKYDELGARVGASADVVRYHVKKLEARGYIIRTPFGWEPTGKVIFIPAELANTS